MRTANFAIALCVLSGLAAYSEPPTAQLQNKQLKIKIYLPGPAKGFYTATRFDWSGVIGDLEFAGHHLYRPWFTSVDPAVRDVSYVQDGIAVGPNTAMTGPAEEFQKPIGYETAKVGDNFLKVGVGLLRKPDDAAYFLGKHFDIADGGKWKIRKNSNSITFEQVLGGPDSKYGYVYIKTIRLIGDTGKMVIEHHLRNTGRTSISTRLYDHNFLTVNSMGVRSGYTNTVPYVIKSAREPDAAFVHLEGNRASYVADLHGQDRVAFGLQGFSGDAKGFNFYIENRTAKVGVRIEGDRPLTNATVWSIRSILAVEPFIDVSTDPGKEFSWSYTYTYSDLRGAY